MRYVFIVNLSAGNKKITLKLIETVKKVMDIGGFNYKIVYTEYPTHAMEIARQEAQVGDEFVAFSCGGDGTIFEVVNGLAGFKNAILGVLPIGTGNDFVKSFGKREDFLDINKQISGNIVDCDLIKADDVYSINQCSVGMDAMVGDNVKHFKRFHLSGGLAYNLAVVYTLFCRFGAKLKISIDNGPFVDKKCLFATCANGRYYGGGYYSAPTAITNDGFLEHSILNVSSKLKMIPLLGQYKKGLHIDKDYCEYGKCSSMEIIADREIAVNVDGEIFKKKRVKFEIIKKGIRLLIPHIC